LTATVMSNGGAATGTVTFTEGGLSVGAATLSGQGIATLVVSTLAPGNHSLVANYAGDGRANASVSVPLSLAVKQTSSLGLTSATNPTLTLSPVTLTATLHNSGAAAATGLITFTEGSTQLGTAPLDPSGRATLTLPSLSAGTHTIVASYAGDGSDFGSASAPLSQAIQLRSSTVGVSGTQTDASNPQQVTLIAAVHTDGSAPPTGSVTFSSGTLQIGTAPVNPNGVATLTILIEANSGKEDVTASYSGDAVFAGSTSPSTLIQAGPATQFMLTVNPPTLSIATRQHTTLQLQLSSIKGFSDTIQLGCLGLPFAATCTFTAPQSKLAADGTTTLSLTVDTANPLGQGAQTSALLNRDLRHPLATLLCFLPAALLLGFGLRRRRNLPRLLVLLCAATLILGAAGCSGLQGSSTPPGTYNFKITASGLGSGATQSQMVTLTVTP
ncbi:MAG TPA: Ig-like domain-containing protein, partial [Acidobacteriaceae bacterium]|nr:Ig-like domain-containing protein [Acidobacteriaceae bacterium]